MVHDVVCSTTVFCLFFICAIFLKKKNKLVAGLSWTLKGYSKSEIKEVFTLVFNYRDPSNELKYERDGNMLLLLLCRCSGICKVEDIW